jgi:hypothetical protein
LNPAENLDSAVQKNFSTSGNPPGMSNLAVAVPNVSVRPAFTGGNPAIWLTSNLQKPTTSSSRGNLARRREARSELVNKTASVLWHRRSSTRAAHAKLSNSLTITVTRRGQSGMKKLQRFKSLVAGAEVIPRIGRESGACIHPPPSGKLWFDVEEFEQTRVSAIRTLCRRFLALALPFMRQPWH